MSPSAASSASSRRAGRLRLEGKVAIVTGTSSGIGLAIARVFLDEGARVLGVARRASDELAAHPRFESLQQDLVAEGAARHIVEACQARFGAPDVLVNNAGMGNAGPLLTTTDADLERYFKVNLFAPFALSREVIPLMRGRGGAIVNIASVFGLVGATSAAYVPTKSAMIGMTRNMATEFGRDGIRVNTLAPGLVSTPLVEQRLETDTWFRKMLHETNPMGRGAADPVEVATACLFLASDDASFVNGIVLPVDGGWSMAKMLPRPVE